MFDLTQVNSHEGARIWFNNIQEKCPGLPCILLAHKADEYHGPQKQIGSAVSLFPPFLVPPLSLPYPSPIPTLSLPCPSPLPLLSLSSCFLLHLDLILMQGYIAYFETSAKQGTSVSTAIKFLASHITKDDSMVLNKQISRTPVNARIDACTVSLYTFPFLCFTYLCVVLLLYLFDFQNIVDFEAGLWFYTAQVEVSVTRSKHSADLVFAINGHQKVMNMGQFVEVNQTHYTTISFIFSSLTNTSQATNFEN